MSNSHTLPDLSIQLAEERQQLARPSRTWTGFSVEHVAVEAAEAYRFQWSGDVHYLALHDMVLDDGGSLVDDLSRDHTHDLRDTITFLPKGCSIEGWALPAQRPNSFTALYFDTAQLHEDLDARYRSAVPGPVLYARDGPLHLTMTKLARLVSDPRTDDLYAESACMLAAIEALDLEVPDLRGKLSAAQLAAVVDFIEANLTAGISLSDLAAAAGLSRFHFGRAFKLSTGDSPYAFVLARKLDKAVQLLSETPVLPIETVAQLSGFQNTAQLRRQLQQATGKSPRAFRRTLS